MFVLLLSMVGWGFAPSPYQTLSLADALHAPPGTLVRVWGRFRAEVQGQARIDGQLVSGKQILPVAGQAFDWQPEPGRVELWGKLEPGPVLEFHNGRNPGETRRPRPTPTLREGETVRLWLEVRAAGPARFSFVQGITEDRRVFFLPKYEGQHGLVCLRGEVGFLSGPGGRRTLLRGATPCKVTDVK